MKTRVWPSDLHIQIRTKILAGLGECAPGECENGGDCSAYGFGNAEDVYPLGGCCEVLTVWPGSFSRATPKTQPACWTFAQQEFGVRLLTTWPTGSECRGEMIVTALDKLQVCGQQLLCVLNDLQLPEFNTQVTGQAKGVVFDGVLRALPPRGGCVGWEARLTVGR